MVSFSEIRFQVVSFSEMRKDILSKGSSVFKTQVQTYRYILFEETDLHIFDFSSTSSSEFSSTIAVKSNSSNDLSFENEFKKQAKLKLNAANINAA